jgi:hypothetical protein
MVISFLRVQSYLSRCHIVNIEAVQRAQDWATYKAAFLLPVRPSNKRGQGRTFTRYPGHLILLAESYLSRR